MDDQTTIYTALSDAINSLITMKNVDVQQIRTLVDRYGGKIDPTTQMQINTLISLYPLVQQGAPAENYQVQGAQFASPFTNGDTPS